MYRSRLETNFMHLVLVASTSLTLPAIAGAQNSAGQAPTRSRFTALRNSCLQISSMPSPLVASPEGRVILNMQRDLTNVSVNMALHPDSADGRPGMRKIAILRHGVDSLAREYARSIDTAASRNPHKKMGFGRGRGGTPRDSMGVFVRGEGRGTFDGVRIASLSDTQRDPIEMRIRELETEVRELARGGDQVTVELVLSRTANAPGYLGITSSSEALTSVINGVERVGYCDYPMVESIEPGSPADKAGFLTGDTLLAYNGRDLRQFDVIYGQLLIPGRTVLVRFRRGGKDHELPVTVARRENPTAAGTAESLPCDNDEPRATCEARVTASMRGFMLPPVAGGTRKPSLSSDGSGFPPAGPPPGGGGRYGDFPFTISSTASSGLAIFAGAHLTAVSAAFAANVGVEPGVLVMDVVPSSPVSEAGLQPGDVIVEVNGVTVRDVLALRSALLTKAADRSATMQVSGRSVPRAAQRGQSGVRTVVVRW